jgi:glycosyltransferase involved in cell wall biosynthesis
VNAVETPDVSAIPVSERSHSRVRPAIGILVSRFPRLDQTDLLRELNELERQGQPILLIPLLRDSSQVVHEDAKPWLRRALYVPLFSAGIARANIARFVRHPLQYVRLLSRLILATLVRPRTLIGTMALFPKSVYLADALQRRGLQHIHAHVASHAATMAYIIAALSDLTFSFTVHGPDVFVHQLLLGEKLAKAKFVRAVSTFNKAFLRGLFPALAKQKIEVVHMGLRPEVYAHPSAESSRNVPIRLLSVARLVPSEGISYLLDACESLIHDGVDLDCTIVGDGPQAARIEAVIAEHGLSDHIHLRESVTDRAVAKLMGDCDVFVLPSVIAEDGQMDGIPASLMEAMAADRPVVASALSGIPELVEDGVSGLLVDATQPVRVAAALRRLAGDSALRERMGRAAHEKVRREFDIRVTAAAFAALLDRQQQPRASGAERVGQLEWGQLGFCAIGARRIVERRDSIVVDVTASDGISKRDVIVKLHGDPAAARYEYDALLKLGHLMTATTTEAGSTTLYTVPRALMIDERHAAVITERAAGETLQSMLRRKRAKAVVLPLRRAGTWLRLMQEQTRTGEDGRFIEAATIAVALRDLDLAAAADRTLRRHRQAISDRLCRLWWLVAERPLPVVGSHGDFSPANVFLSAGHVVAVNLDGFRAGLPLADVASFLLHLKTRFPRHSDAGAAFLAGYTDAAIDPPSLMLFRMTAALQLLTRSAGGASPGGSVRRLLIEEIIGGLR